MLEPEPELGGHYRPDNYTLDRIQSTGERYLWIIYNITVALCSLTGDTIVLVASVKYKAINLHRVIVVLIQHLAVSDLLLTLFRVVPNIISLTADRWVLGTFLCTFVMNAQWLAYWMTGILTCCLATSKLLVVRFPFRTRFCTTKQAHLACGVLWGLSLVSPPQLLLIFWRDHGAMYFDYTMYMCMYDFLSPYRRSPIFYATLVYTGVVQILMYIIIPLASVLLVIEARKAAGRLGEQVRWQGVLTVTMCTAIYFISTLPAIVVAGISSVSISTRRTMHFVTNLNIVTNFFVYCLTVVTFRGFLKTRVRYLAVKFGLSPQPVKSTRRASRPASRTMSNDQDMKTSVQLTSL